MKEPFKKCLVVLVRAIYILRFTFCDKILSWTIIYVPGVSGIDFLIRNGIDLCIRINITCLSIMRSMKLLHVWSYRLQFADSSYGVLWFVFNPEKTTEAMAGKGSSSLGTEFGLWTTSGLISHDLFMILLSPIKVHEDSRHKMVTVEAAVGVNHQLSVINTLLLHLFIFEKFK